MIGCLAIDLDDTLLRNDLTISVADQTAIKTAVAKGVKVLLVSGRMVRAMRPLAAFLGLNLPLIAYNGALIQDFPSGKVLYHRPVPGPEALEVADFLKKAGIHINVYLNDELYMEELTEWGKSYAAISGVTPHIIGDLRRVLLNNVSHKLLGLAEPPVIDELLDKLRQKYRGTLQLVKSKPTYLEVLAEGVSKGEALRKLAAEWGLSRSEVMAIGNAPNDLSMIEWAGIGAAIGNADAVVKERADLVVADNEHGGVAEAIERFII